MIVNLTVSNDHSVKADNKSFGVQGDHKVTTLFAAFENNDYEYTKGRFNFEKNDLVECTEYMTLTDDQTLEYELPYNLLCDCTSIVVSVTALTSDGRIFESKAVQFEVSKNELDPNIIPTLCPLEEITITENNQTVLPNEGFYGISKANVALPMYEIEIVENGEYTPSEEFEGISKVVVDIFKPTLHTPTIERGSEVIGGYEANKFSLAADTNNGNFARGYKTFINDELVYTSGSLINTPRRISLVVKDALDTYPTGNSTVKIKLHAKGFVDSEFSNELTWTPEREANDIHFIMGENGWICQGFSDGESGDANIPSIIKGVPVVGLVENAFRASGITSVSIPGSIERISDRAFQNNRKTLTSATLGYGVRHIGMLSFDRALLLEHIDIPDSVEYIGVRAFQECSSLKTVVIPNSVTTLDAYVFELCSGLETVYLGSGLTTMKDPFFGNTSIKTIYCDFDEGAVAGAPWGAENATVYYNWKTEGTEGLEYTENSDGTYTCSGMGTATDTDIRIASVYNGREVTAVGEGAFDMDASLLGKVALTSVHLPNTIKSIGRRAFLKCRDATSINIPESVEYIGQLAFGGTGITSIVIPDSVTEIKSYAFGNCYAAETLIIGSGVTVIPTHCFSECSALRTVTFSAIPNSVNVSAFYRCNAIRVIYVPWSEGEVDGAPWGATNAVIHYAGGAYTVGLKYHYEEQADNPEYGIYRGYHVSGNGTNTETEVRIPPRVDGIDVVGIWADAFENSGIVSIIIPETVKRLSGASLSAASIRTVRIKGRPSMGAMDSDDSGERWVYCFERTEYYEDSFDTDGDGEIDEGPYWYMNIYNNETIEDIYVPWSEGEVEGAPWGAVKATIHYNSEV